MEKISKSTKIAVGISAAAVLTTGLLYLWRRSHREAEEDKAELEAQNAYEDPGYGTSVMVTKVEAEARKKILEDSEIMYFLGLALPKGIIMSILNITKIYAFNLKLISIYIYLNKSFRKAIYGKNRNYR